MSLLAIILIVLILALLWPAIAVSKLLFILIAVLLIALVWSAAVGRGW